jgi:hypothetical protein
MSLRRLYHKHVKHHHRFNIAVVLTIVAACWIIVPAVVRIIESAGSYAPAGYDPRDVSRGEWLVKRGPIAFETFALTWEDAAKLLLFLVVAVAWLAVAPGTERRSSRR